MGAQWLCLSASCSCFGLNIKSTKSVLYSFVCFVFVCTMGYRVCIPLIPLPFDPSTNQLFSCWRALKCVASSVRERKTMIVNYRFCELWDNRANNLHCECMFEIVFYCLGTTKILVFVGLIQLHFHVFIVHGDLVSQPSLWQFLQRSAFFK